jgi:ATP/maltotriose-dependent transcriptional regulator MalT/DNA-binding SARP family transcriptional activator
MAEPLLVKLQIPSVRPDTVIRQRLLDLVMNSLDRKLLTIIGDAGYGKTTLLAQVQSRAHLPCIFISLETDDSDLVTFFSSLIWGLEKLHSGLAKRCKGLLQQGSDIGQNPRLAMGTLLNELVEKRNEELFIILDDYHNLSEDSRVHEAMDFFIDHLPPTVHILIASRREVPLPCLSKLRAKQNSENISRDSLKFDENDTKILLAETYRIDMSEKELKGVLEKTEGWITGLHLILQAAKRDGCTVQETIESYLNDRGDLFGYFAGEIFNREKPEVREFLKKSSVLDTMTAESCGHVLGVKGPAGRLKELARSNLFVSQSGESVYRYHRLFREFLYGQLSDAQEKRLLHGRAADFYEKGSDRNKAIEHYIKAGKNNDAVRLIALEREGMINRAQFSQLRIWLEMLSSSAFEKYPWLYAVQAVLYKEKGKLEQAGEFYQRAEKGLKAEKGKNTSSAYVLYEKSIVLHRKGEYTSALRSLEEAFRACPSENGDLKISILGFTAQVWLEGLGDTKKAGLYLDKASKLLKGSNNKMQAVYIDQKRAILLESAGEKRQAFNVYKGIIEKIGDKYSHLVGSYFHNAAKVSLDYGRMEWAEQCLVKGQALCQGYEDIFSRSMLEFGFGYLHLFRGNWSEAEKRLDNALKIFGEMNWTRSICIALRQMSRLGRYRGDLVTAEKYLDRMKQQTLGPLDRIAVLLEQTLIEIMEGQYAQASESLSSCREPAIKYFGKMGEITCNLAEAGIKSGQSKKKDALVCLGKAIALSREYGFDGLLSCELRANPDLSKLAVSCQEEKLYLLTIPAFSPAAVKVTKDYDLKFELFGPPKIFHGKKDITSDLRHQAQELLCLLAYNRERGLTRDELVQALWPAARSKQAVDNFHLLLFELRKGLQKALGRQSGKVVVKENGRYGISLELSVESDTSQADEQWMESREAEKRSDSAAAKESLNRALNFYKGDFCSGWESDWVQDLSRKYTDRREKILLKLGALHFRDGEIDRSLENYSAAIEANLACEEAARGLIRIYGAQGKYNEVKTVFTRLQRSLQREFKSQPAKETLELYNNISM